MKIVFMIIVKERFNDPQSCPFLSISVSGSILMPWRLVLQVLRLLKNKQHYSLLTDEDEFSSVAFIFDLYETK